MENAQEPSPQKYQNNLFERLIDGVSDLFKGILRIIGYIFWVMLCIIVLVLVFKFVGLILGAILGLFGFHRRDD